MSKTLTGDAPAAGTQCSGRIPTTTRCPASRSDRSRLQRSPAVATDPGPVASPSSMFIGGVPMKPATKRVAGAR